MKNIIQTPLRGVFAVSIISILVLAFSFGISEAHTDPEGCVASGVSLSIVTYRSDGTTPVGAGIVAVGETLKYQAILSHAGAPNCNYSGGDLAIITPDGVNHDVDGGSIPLISSGSPFMSTQISYVVSADDIDGDSDVDASAVYSNGASHLGTNNVSPVGATAPAASVVAAQIIVDKVSDPTSDQDFEFDPSWGENFFLSDTDTPVNSGTLAPGAYSVAEVNIPTGWVSEGSSCVSSFGDTETAGSLDLDAGETITCTFNNNQPTGNIIVVKQTDPDGASQSFEFDPSWGENFFLNDGQDNDSGTLAAGTYSVAEVNIPTGWVNESISCVSSLGDTETAGDLELDGEETITCTFNNTQPTGNIVVVKQTDPDGDPQSFEFDPSWGENFSLSDGEDNDSGTLAAGDYTIAEVNMPDNWTLESTVCVSSLGDTETAGDLELEDGETITCTFSNTFEPPFVAQYCSPGYWKQSQHFDSWVTYSPTDTFASVFGEDITIMWSAKGKPVATTNPTLQQVLEANGGGISSLARAAVGALLNASALETEMTPEEVISAFQDTYPGTDADYEALKAEYTAEHNCPLN